MVSSGSGAVKGRGMAVALLALLVLSSWLDMLAGEVYKVGDSAGWTIIGSPNYTAWASTKTFQVGDTLMFEYNKQYHNVMKVNRMDYRACNVSSPRGTYTTGNDSITITTAGHHYFICGVVGHCSLGQKVDIRIPKHASSVAPPASIPPSSSPSGPAPQGSHAPSGQIGGGWASAAASAALAAVTCLMM